MKWKIWTIAFLVLAILGLLFFSRQGNNYLEFLRSRINNLISGLGILPSLNFGSAYFNMQLSSDKESFKQISFNLENSYVLAEGLCVGNIKAGNIILEKSGKSCKVKLEKGNGKVEFTIANTALFEVSSPSVVIDELNYLPTDSELNLNFEILPSKLTLSYAKSSKLNLNILFGDVKKLKEDGTLDIFKNLYNESIEISNFLGSIELNDNNYQLRGTSTQIKGINFNWFA